MENNKKKESDSLWGKFVNSFDDQMYANPFAVFDDTYMTPKERTKMYDEAVQELKLKVNALKQQKKKQK
tara:strand:- start:4757 stop:4963 length:207 start_codon:yes stop_codon:yes gene_type:complete